MKFKDVDVIKTKDNYHYIEWDVESNLTTPESTDDYYFLIYYGLDPESHFEVILSDIDAPFSIDGATGPLAFIHRLKQFDFNEEFYYKIAMISKHDPDNVTYSEVASVGGRTNGLHETMQYAEQTLYGMYNGEPLYIVKKKTVGARCPRCWSEFRQQRLRTDCHVCHGSGFRGGYYHPIQIQGAFDATPKKNDLQETNQDMTNYIRCRISNYPLVRPEDIIVNKDSYQRYIVISIENTKLPLISSYEEHSHSECHKYRHSKQNYILSQILTIKEINPSDTQYTIPLPEHIPPIPHRESYTFDAGTAESGDFIWYIDGNARVCHE